MVQSSYVQDIAILGSSVSEILHGTVAGLLAVLMAEFSLGEVTSRQHQVKYCEGIPAVSNLLAQSANTFSPSFGSQRSEDIQHTSRLYVRD